MRKALLVLTACFVAVSASAQSRDTYLEQLRIVQAKIERDRALKTADESGALSSALLFRLTGRYYEVGDHWDVAAWLVDHPNMIPNAAAHAQDAARQSGVRKGGIFRYSVTAVKGAPDPAVTLEVTQLDAHGYKPIDAKVSKLILKMNDKMTQSEKSYVLDNRAGPVPVAPNGLRSRFTELELFPLDVPELVSAISESPKRMPELPKAASELMSRLGISPSLSEAVWFEQDDFFGRPIQALWEKGKPWPSYFRTSNGIAVLLTR